MRSLFHMLFLTLFILAGGCGDPRSTVTGDVEIIPPADTLFLVDEAPTELRLTFQIRHSLQGNVALKVASRSCGCINVEIPNNSVPPNVLNPVSFLVAAAPGTYERSAIIRLEGQDGQHRDVELKTSYSIVRSRQLTPNRFIADAKHDHCDLSYVRVYRTEDELVNRPLEVRGLPAELMARELKQSPPVRRSDGFFESRWNLQLAAAKEASPSLGNKSRIEIGLKDEKGSSLEWEWRDSRILRVSPDLIEFGVISAGTPVTRNCFLIASGVDLPRIFSLECDSPSFSASVVDRDDVTSVRRINVTYAAKEAGISSGKLKIVTESGDFQVLLAGEVAEDKK